MFFTINAFGKHLKSIPFITNRLKSGIIYFKIMTKNNEITKL